MTRSIRIILFSIAFVAALLVASSTVIKAQGEDVIIPRLLSFQGVLVQPDGTVYPDGQYLIAARLYTTETDGVPVYIDEMSTAVVGGVFNLILGEQNSLEGVDFTRQLWLEIGLPGTPQETFSPRTKLTSAPYAFMAQNSVTAGGLSPNAKGAVLSLNGGAGNLAMQGMGGLVITRNDSTINIDATNVTGNITITTLDSVIRVSQSATNSVRVGVNDTSISSRHLKPSGAVAGVYGDSAHIPRINVGRDGRITSITEVPLSLLAIPISSGRYINTSTARQYSVTINTRTSQPSPIEDLLATARILVTMESNQGISSCIVSARTQQGFTVVFSGGLPPNAAFNWIVLNL
jgi:hypothetical protein